MTERPPAGAIDAAVKTTSKIVDAISSPVLITMILVFGGLIGSIMFLWNAQSERNRELYINLVESCVPNNHPQKDVEP